MFDKFGQPNGYGQEAPGKDQPAPPGQGTPRKMQPLQQAVMGPSQYPADPGFTLWRQSTGPAKPIAPTGASAPMAQGGLTPNGAAPTSFLPGDQFHSSAPPQNLSDPATWMGLVGNDAQLTDFVTKGLGHNASIPGRVDYYKKVVQGQPGANPTEQAGSADYYNKMFASDPASGVRAGSGGQHSPLLRAIMPQSDSNDQEHQYLHQMLQNLQM